MKLKKVVLWGYVSIENFFLKLLVKWKVFFIWMKLKWWNMILEFESEKKSKGFFEISIEKEEYE